ncbi:uncharacterized protein LOC128883129 [Hylaeus volcanicus]|uniref:uncharacterized protein LOC128883129 n=1 Tax=Hylaeus volcanicus TaxID=313075 RepID=UPI0023B7818B|nr:uncharacterized protein LOC128883129 [Hylaeus volcanicus]
MNHSYAHQFCDANTLMNEKICVKHFQAIKRIVSRKKKSCGSFWQLNDQSLEGFICPYKLTNSLLHYGYLDEALLLNMFMASQIVTTACPKCSLVPVSSQVAYKRLSHNNTLQLKKYGVHKNLILQLTLAMLKKNKVTLDFLFQFFQLIQHILNFLVTVHTSVNQQTVEEFFNQNLVSSLPEKSFYSCNGNNLTPAILCLLTNIHFLFHLGILPTLRSLCQTEKIFDTPSIILAIQVRAPILGMRHKPTCSAFVLFYFQK